FDAAELLRQHSRRQDLEERTESLVRREQSKQLYSRGLVALVVNIINGGVVVAALWGSVPARPSLAWLAVLTILVCVRGLYWRIHGLAEVAEEPYDSDRWLWVWTIGTAITGAVWGVGGVLLFPAASITGQDLLLFVIGGMVAGASASMSSYQPAF